MVSTSSKSVLRSERTAISSSAPAPGPRAAQESGQRPPEGVSVRTTLGHRTFPGVAAPTLRETERPSGPAVTLPLQRSARARAGARLLQLVAHAGQCIGQLPQQATVYPTPVARVSVSGLHLPSRCGRSRWGRRSLVRKGSGSRCRSSGPYHSSQRTDKAKQQEPKSPGRSCGCCPGLPGAIQVRLPGVSQFTVAIVSRPRRWDRNSQEKAVGTSGRGL